MTITEIADKLADALQADLKGGERWKAYKKFATDYPALLEVINEIIETADSMIHTLERRGHCAMNTIPIEMYKDDSYSVCFDEASDDYYPPNSQVVEIPLEVWNEYLDAQDQLLAMERKLYGHFKET